MLLHPQGPPAWLQKAVGSGNEMWALCISLCLQKALGGSRREPVETGSGLAVTYHCAPLAAHIPSCRAASQSLVSQKAWLSVQYREGGQWGRTEGAVPRDTETDPETFLGRCCPLLV